MVGIMISSERFFKSKIQSRQEQKLQTVKDRRQNYGVYHHISFTRADVWWCVSVLINYMYQVHVVQYIHTCTPAIPRASIDTYQ